MPDNLKIPYGVLSVNTAEAYESDQRRNFSSKQQDLIFNGEVLKSFTVLENENFKVIFPSKLIETCDRCCRNSTKAYPLTIDKVEYEKIINKKYEKRCNRSENNLCQLCSKYVTQIKSTWNFAWPSVIYSILVQSSNENLQKLFQDLPRTLQECWGQIVEESQKSEVFQDITHDKKRFHQLIDSYDSENYKLAMNNFCFPCVMSFCGSTEFIDTVGMLPFHHLLNYFDPKFLSFKANLKRNIQAIRPYYLDETFLKLPF